MKKHLKSLLIIFTLATVFTACAPDDALDELKDPQIMEVESTGDTDGEEDDPILNNTGN